VETVSENLQTGLSLSAGAAQADAQGGWRGDGQVTLYWDRAVPNPPLIPCSKNTILKVYKIYKATDQNFNDVFSITDGQRDPHLLQTPGPIRS
jgi:hypothetical protein